MAAKVAEPKVVSPVQEVEEGEIPAGKAGASSEAVPAATVVLSASPEASRGEVRDTEGQATIDEKGEVMSFARFIGFYRLTKGVFCAAVAETVLELSKLIKGLSAPGTSGLDKGLFGILP